MLKKKGRVVPFLLVTMMIFTVFAAALGIVTSNTTGTYGVSKSASNPAIWKTKSSGGTDIGFIFPQFDKGSIFAADSITAKFEGYNSYTSSASLSIKTADGETATGTLSSTSNGTKSVSGTLWKAATAYSIKYTASKSGGNYTFKN